MDGSKKRRICGVAAFSATALASLLGAQPAAAEPGAPPGLNQACESRPGPDENAFRQGFPIKWEGGFRCDTTDEGIVYDWWKKVET